MRFVLFGCIRDRLVAFRNSCKTGRTCAKVRATKSLRIFSHRTHPIHPIGPKLTFWCVSYYLGAFGTVWLPYETRCKTGRTSAKSSCHEVASEFFATNASDPPPLDPKLTFWCVSYHSGAFGTIWLPYETRWKTSANVRATKSRPNFSKRTHPIHPI